MQHWHVSFDFEFVIQRKYHRHQVQQLQLSWHPIWVDKKQVNCCSLQKVDQKSEQFQSMEMVDQSKQDIDGLIDSEVDGLVETGTKFDCPVEGLKNGTGEPESETTSK
jgi:hypothetical protein